MTDARSRRVAVAVLVVLVWGVGCRSVPTRPSDGPAAPVERADGRTVEAFFVDPETGRLVRECPEPTPILVTFDSVDTEGGRLTLVGRAEIEGRGGYGFVRFQSGYDRTSIPEAMPPPGRSGPYPWAGAALADSALAYGAVLYRSGRFALRAPLAEVASDTLLFAYNCVGINDWPRVPVADVLAGVRIVTSEPGAVPNPEAQGWRGLRLRAVDRSVAPGDSVIFELTFRPPAPQRPFPAPAGWVPPLATPSDEVRSPEFGTACTWRLERWADGWAEMPRAWWTEETACTLQAISFVRPGVRPEAFHLSHEAAPGRYRWCLNAAVVEEAGVTRHAICSTSFGVTP